MIPPPGGPGRPPTLGRLVETAAREYAGRIALRDGDGAVLTFTDLATRVGRIRARLRGLGLRPGDRVALVMDNGITWPSCWLGVVTAGLVAVPISTRSGTDDLAWMVDHSGARLVLVDAGHLDLVHQVVHDGPAVEVVGPHWPDTDASDPPADVPVDTLANLQYTSGTTGFPKGCRLSHRFWTHMGAGTARLMDLTDDDVLVTAQPYSYIDPQWNTVASLWSGAELAILDGFHPSTFMASVADLHVTVFYCLAAMPVLLLKQPPTPADHAHRLRHVFCSAIPAAAHAAIEDRWGVPWYELYGMTETGLNIAVTPQDHDELVGSGSMGRVVDHCDATVVDADGMPVPDGVVGELLLRGRGFMDGYHDDEAATAAFFADGWAHTGDLVVRDADGRFTLRGRRKDMIRRGGENIAAAQVEAALVGHPDVLEAAVLAVADDVLGEEVRAVVVAVPGHDLRPSDLRDHVAERLATFKVPRFWEIRDHLPHTPSERVAKHLVAPMAADAVDLRPPHVTGPGS